MATKFRLNLDKKILSINGSSLKLSNNLEKAEFEKEHSTLILEYNHKTDYRENSSIYSWIQNFENGHQFNLHCDDYDEEGAVIGLWSEGKDMNVEIIEY